MLMESGKSATEATQIAIAKISSFYPTFEGALVAVAMNGSHGEWCTRHLCVVTVDSI